MLEIVEGVFSNTRAACEAEAELDALAGDVLPHERATLAVGRTALNLSSLAAALALFPLGAAACWPFAPTSFYGIGVAAFFAVVCGGVLGLRLVRGTIRARMMRRMARRVRSRLQLSATAVTSTIAIPTTSRSH